MNLSSQEIKRKLLTQWCLAPWHSWLKTESQWLDLVAEFWVKLPDAAVAQVMNYERPLVVLPPITMSRVVRVSEPLPQGAWFLQLDAALLKRPRVEALAILAHEIAHLCVSPVADENLNDMYADQCVMQWGFALGLMKALSADVPAHHPRLVAVKQFLAAKPGLKGAA